MKSYQLLSTFIGHTGTVYRALFLPNNQILSASFDRSLKVWTLERRGDPNAPTDVHEARILSSAFSPSMSCP